MEEPEIINKLIAMHDYTGVLDLDGKVIPFCKTGVSKINLETFLEGSREFKKKRNQDGLLYVPFSFSDHLNLIEGKLKEIELKYPVKFFLKYDLSVEEIIESN